jgi:DNA-binding MarR family transcriptional regulator
MDINSMVERKADLEKRRERLLTKLEIAKEKRAQIYAELQDMGIDPDKVEEEIMELNRKKLALEEDIRRKIEGADAVLNKIEERINTL